MARARPHNAAEEMARQFESLAGSRLGRDPHAVRRRIEMMEQVLENAMVVPGTRIRVGLDAMLGIIPIVGDLLAAAMGAWIVWEARNLGMPRWQLLRMSGNVAFDTAIGAVPLVGDAFDVMFRSNTRNLRIIRKHLDKHHPQTAIIEG